jgi:hypothetical protein
MKIFKKLYKFNIVCYNEKEWNSIQDKLFKLGYCWETGGKNYICCNYSYPRVLRNHRTDDIFGGKYLIMDSYKFMLKVNECIKVKYKFTNAICYIRKQKIEKINAI